MDSERSVEAAQSVTERGKTMLLIQIEAQCVGKFFEVLPGAIEDTEFTIEDLVGQLLLEYFEEVIVDDVTITFSHCSLAGQYHCSIHVQVHCLEKSSAPSPDELGRTELIVERKVRSALAELFGAVQVKRVAISLSPCENAAH